MLNGPRAVGGLTATVLAFDGIVADTLPLRASALGSALSALTSFSAEQTGTRTDESLQRAIAGRTFAEAARALLAAGSADGDEAERETLVDLVAMDAGRRYSAMLSSGVSLCPGATALLTELASTGKVVARADSIRRDVEAILGFAAIESGFTFVRCSDDMPRSPGLSSLEGSWQAIDRRLRASGVEVDRRIAIEVAGTAADAARPFVAEVRSSRFEKSA